jgi:hypothetical protein
MACPFHIAEMTKPGIKYYKKVKESVISYVFLFSVEIWVSYFFPRETVAKFARTYLKSTKNL